MIRDKRRNKDYFNTYIEKEKESFEEFKELLYDGSVPKQRLHLLKQMLFNDKINIIIARYSRGDSIDKIILEHKELLEIWKDICCREFLEVEYEESLWVISIAILLEMDEALDGIKKRLDKENINDWLFNFLLSKGIENPAHIEGELLVPKECQALKEAICSSDKKKLIHYLEKEWYSNFKDYGWYDSHKKTKRGWNLYFGYWCFEAAAVMKLLKWDDSELAQQQYYPYDLAHYKE